MRKKQLVLQNAALFAEIERKTNELEARNIRIEDLTAAVETFKNEKAELEEQLICLRAENAELKEKEKQLTDSLLAATIATKEKPLTAEAAVDSTCQAEQTEASVETAQAEPSPTPSTAEASISAMPVLEEPVLEKPALDEPVVVPTESEPGLKQADPPNLSASTPMSQPESEALRAHGAQLIGRLTRLTAQVLSKLETEPDEHTESLKNLVLGKNESFKYQILSLLSGTGTPEEIKENMNRLADEATDYLQQTNGIK